MNHSTRRLNESEFICDECGYYIRFTAEGPQMIERGERGAQHSFGLIVDVQENEKLLPLPEDWPRAKP